MELHRGAGAWSRDTDERRRSVHAAPDAAAAAAADTRRHRTLRPLITAGRRLIISSSQACSQEVERCNVHPVLASGLAWPAVQAMKGVSTATPCIALASFASQ